MAKQWKEEETERGRRQQNEGGGSGEYVQAKGMEKIGFKRIF